MPESASNENTKDQGDTPKDSSPKTPLIQVIKERVDLRRKEPPLVKLQVTNPIEYLKRWWKRVVRNEGIDFRFRIRPLTAIAIALVVAIVYFGVGNFVPAFSLPFFKYLPSASPTPTPDPSRDTAFSGTLQFTSSTNRYYLVTASSEAINLDVPENVDLSELVGRRIFATGKYNPDNRTLFVVEASDLEILPKEIITVPTSPPTPSPTPTPTPTEPPTPTPVESPTPTPEPSPSPT